MMFLKAGQTVVGAVVALVVVVVTSGYGYLKCKYEYLFWSAFEAETNSHLDVKESEWKTPEANKCTFLLISLRCLRGKVFLIASIRKRLTL